jgi:hypothetical protein
VPLEKAGVACLECGPDLGKGDAVLLWLVTPTWFASLRFDALERAADELHAGHFLIGP